MRTLVRCLLVTLIVLLELSSCYVWAETDRPNFIVIMADDMGYGDASCYGNTKFETKNIDRMAREGIRFTDFHSSGAVCSPTRAGLLTGRYQQRSGISTVVYAAKNRPQRKWGMQDRELTLAEALRQTGYATGVSGKWHLGYDPQYNPRLHGFDFFRGYVSGNVDFISHVDGVGDHDWWHGQTNTKEEGYTTHLITKHAVEFIKRNSERPFFLYVAHEAPHYPYQGPNDPAIREIGNPGQSKGPKESHVRAYREMMVEMDRGVGDILDTLAEKKIDDKTLVLFFSDNGGTGPGSNGPLRGKKGSLWEGGHRVPAVARWPKKIAPDQTIDDLAITIDIMPTLCSLAKAKLTDDFEFDGVDLSRLLLENERLPNRKVFWSHGESLAMRDGVWKLIRNPQSRNQPEKAGALYNLESDLAESTNLSHREKARAQTMSVELDAWFEEVTKNATPQP